MCTVIAKTTAVLFPEQLFVTFNVVSQGTRFLGIIRGHQLSEGDGDRSHFTVSWLVYKARFRYQIEITKGQTLCQRKK